jgi:hypothetical protein
MWSSPNSNLNLGSVRRVQCPNKKNVIDTLDLGTERCGLHVQSAIRLCCADLPLNLTWTNDLRQMGVKWLIFLISPPIHMSMECGSVSIKEQKSRRYNTCLKETGLRIPILITTLHSIGNTVGRTFVSS